MADSKKDINRRQFLRNGALSVTAIAAVGLGAQYLSKKSKENEQVLLRPPGAFEEETFLYACIKCGLCVQICPVSAIKLSDIDNGLAYGTPYIDPREQACDFSCDAMQCVETCPTAALDFLPFKKAGEGAVADIDLMKKNQDEDFNPFVIQSKAMKANTKMGIAEIDLRTCLANKGQGFQGAPREPGFKGVYRSPDPDRAERKASPVNDHIFNVELCNLCVSECPIGEDAIRMESKVDEFGVERRIPVVQDKCTGCGLCVMICPSQPHSISIKKKIS
jgi:ferredoxin-type protein NapG